MSRAQPTLCAAVGAVFERADAGGFEGVRFDHHTTTEDGHGRHEERSVSVIYDPQGVPSGWPDVAARTAPAQKDDPGG